MTVIGLDNPRARRLELVGGKATNLAELRAAGFDVPAGFCVTTDAYRAAAGAADLDAVLAAAAPAAPGAAARAALLAAPVPTELEVAVAEAYAKLGDRVPGAVRASATPQDPPPP